MFEQADQAARRDSDERFAIGVCRTRLIDVNRIAVRVIGRFVIGTRSDQRIGG